VPLTWNAFGGPMDLYALLANYSVNRGEPGEVVWSVPPVGINVPLLTERFLIKHERS